MSTGVLQPRNCAPPHAAGPLQRATGGDACPKRVLARHPSDARERAKVAFLTGKDAYN